ncbi:MAG TPA: CHAT domain-containing protein, partial [Blastocatellia bacterium]
MSQKNILKLEDLGEGKVKVSWQMANVARDADPIRFDDPLAVADHLELRWYLEEFLQFPYGAERYRAEQIEHKMEQWGEALFRQVFVKLPTDPDPRGFYQEAVRTGLEHCELCVVSDDQAFLNIPWELMYDPTPGRGYLAPHLAGFYRQRKHQKIEALAAISPTQPFRVLLVIARPYGERDVPLGTIARPMTEALRALRPRIELEVLRPPTFDELQKRLNAHRGFYNLVHFDGHGVFAAPASGLVQHFAAKAEFGHLVFENEDGSEHIVNSQELGQALATCKVPLFVLNACQSAQEGKADPFGSVASQLLAVGARGVLAMSYSVYATTAARFIQRFYESLAEHRTLAGAVAAARLKLFADRAHDSPVGAVELSDWMVPVLYQQEQRYVPVSPKAGTRAKQAEAVDVFEQASAVCPARAFGFIGRDYDILRIERALRSDEDPWVVLSGIGGVGKTELGRGFARWYAETSGCPGGVFATEFEKKADFAQVIGSIAGLGTDFSRFPEPEQMRMLVDYLRKNACLLVWD